MYGLQASVPWWDLVILDNLALSFERLTFILKYIGVFLELKGSYTGLWNNREQKVEVLLGFGIIWREEKKLGF